MSQGYAEYLIKKNGEIQQCEKKVALAHQKSIFNRE